MIKSIKVRLNPNNKQFTKLFQYAGSARFAYNWAISREEENHKQGNQFLSDNDLRKEFTQLKKIKEYEWLNKISCNVTKQAIKDACNAYKIFFKGQCKFPKFKSRKYSTPSFYQDNVKIQFTDTHVKVENFMFKHNGVFYKIKENYNEFELSRYNPKTNKSNLISEFSVSNNKNDGFYQDFELHGKKTKKIDEILNKVNNHFSLDLNLNIGKYHKAIYDACLKNNNTQIATLVMYDNCKAQSYFFKKNENEMQIKKDLINIYEEKKETILGTEIKQIKYNSEHFTEDLFNLFKSDKHLSNFIEENNYSDVIKDGTDISNEKEKDCNEIDR